MVQSVFDDDQCIFIKNHLFSVDQRLFWFSMKVKVTWWLFLPAWVTLKLWKGLFSLNFGMEHLMVQSVFKEHHNSSTQSTRTKYYFSSTQPTRGTHRGTVWSHGDHDNFDDGSYPSPTFPQPTDNWQVLLHPEGVDCCKLKHLLLRQQMLSLLKHFTYNPYQYFSWNQSQHHHQPTQRQWWQQPPQEWARGILHLSPRMGQFLQWIY